MEDVARRNPRISRSRALDPLVVKQSRLCYHADELLWHAFDNLVAQSEVIGDQLRRIRSEPTTERDLPIDSIAENKKEMKIARAGV
jgi:hypothetical protein